MLSDEDEEPDPRRTYSNPPSRLAASDAKHSPSLPPVPSEPRLDLLIGDPLASESISDPLSSDPLSEASDPLTRALQDSELETGTELSSGTDANRMDSTRFGLASRHISVKALHGQCLTLSDQERIRAFVNDFTNRGLLPFLEKHIRQLNEQVSTCLFVWIVSVCSVIHKRLLGELQEGIPESTLSSRKKLVWRWKQTFIKPNGRD